MYYGTPPIVTNGLVLNLDAANTKSYVSGSTTWRDISGNQRNGTLTNGPTFNSGNGGSIVFDGVNDSVQTNYGPTLQNFTVVAWFRSTGGTLEYNRVVDKSYINGLWIGRQSNIVNSWGGGVRESIPPYGRYITLPDNQWNMIVSVRQGTAHTIYGNGVTNFTTGIVSSSPLSTTTFAFGDWSGANNPQRLTGNISQVQIYDRALTPQEVLQNYNALKSRFI